MVAGPVGLHQVPLLGCPPDQVLELVRQVLRDPPDVLAEPALAARVEGWAHEAVDAVALEVDGRRQDPAPGAERHDRRSDGQRRALPEELDLHHRNLCNAIRHNEALKCDHMLGYYGVVATAMGNLSYRKRKYMKWDSGKQRAVTI